MFSSVAMAQLKAPPGAACVKPMGDATNRGDSVEMMLGAVFGGTTVVSVSEFWPQQYSDLSTATAQTWLGELIPETTDVNLADVLTGVGTNLFTFVLSPTLGCSPKHLMVPSLSTPQVTKAPAMICAGV